MGLWKSVKSAVSDVGKVVAAPYTAGASLSGGSLSDIAKGTISNTLAGLPSSGAVGSGTTFSGILDTLLGGIGDNMQSILNLENQKKLAQYQADQQLRLNQDAFNKNLDMWNMENAYNSPAEQMKRFEAAGLNKNLIYGQSNTAGSGPTFEAPKFDVGQYTPVDNRMQRAQLALAMEQHHAQIKNQQIENAMKLQSIQLAERNADREDMLANAQIQALKSNLGIKYDKLALDKSQPKSWLGKMWSDIKGSIAPDVGKGVVAVAKEADKMRGSYDYPAYLQRRVNSYNNSRRKYIKGIHY